MARALMQKYFLLKVLARVASERWAPKGTHMYPPFLTRKFRSLIFPRTFLKSTFYYVAKPEPLALLLQGFLLIYNIWQT